jgi:hypothetical protein
MTEYLQIPVLPMFLLLTIFKLYLLIVSNNQIYTIVGGSENIYPRGTILIYRLKCVFCLEVLFKKISFIDTLAAIFMHCLAWIIACRFPILCWTRLVFSSWSAYSVNFPLSRK